MTNSFAPDSLPIRELHDLLLTAIAPRPIAFVSTVSQSGQVNLSPFSFFNVFSANPPILVFSPARRVRDNTSKHTLDNVLEIPQATISTVNHAMVRQMALASSEYDKGVDEFIKSGLTPADSKILRPPFVKEAPAAFECEVEKIIPLGDRGGAGNLVISRVVYIHLNENYTNTEGNLELKRMDLVARMGGSYYCHANTLFELPKTPKDIGIGVDELPLHAQKSKVLTGNHLGQLGSFELRPSIETLNELKKTEEIKKLLAIEDKEEQLFALHRSVIDLLENGNSEKAFNYLFLVA